MCGIVGYVGTKDACPFLIGGLRRLEYRGYDSAGIATLRSNDSFRVTKVAGRVSQLENAVAQRSMVAPLGIGHTRWATHGPATEENAHPHSGGNGIVTIAHNGVIENYDSLKQTLLAKGYRFVSQTDSEVVAHLIADCLKSSPETGVGPASVQRCIDAVQQTLAMLRGTYGLAILFRDQPDLLIAARCGSPLVIGVGKNEQFLASDTSPLVDSQNASSTLRIIRSQSSDLTAFKLCIAIKDVFDLTFEPSPRSRKMWRSKAMPTTCSRRSMSNRSRLRMHCEGDWIRTMRRPSSAD